MYSLEFRAWIGHKDEIDINEPVEFFSKDIESLQEAKLVINGNDCIKWDEGEYNGEYLTISFKHNPKIFDETGNLVSECKVTDWDDFEFDWIDR
jgi:hypothetical protein